MPTRTGFVSALIVRAAFERNPAFSPVADLSQRVLELAAFHAKLVFNAHGSVGNHTADDQPFALKGAKSFGQHAIGDVRDRTLDGRVARSSLKEGLKNGACPAAADELDCPVKAGAYLRDGEGRIGHDEKFTDLGA